MLMSRFSIALIVIMMLATPLFYLIITNYYAEDLIKVAKIAHVPKEQLDLEKDTVIGLGFQILAVCIILGASIFTVMRFVPTKLWQPFYETLHKISLFRVEEGKVPEFERTNVKEFCDLNSILHNILENSVNSFKVQKEFTENASHELQTPLAIVQGKLDLLLQDENMTEEQSALVQDIYHEIRRMSRLNQNLLLLARIENVQYRMNSHVAVGEKLKEMLPRLETLAGEIEILTDIEDGVPVCCNEVLLESMISNLFVNAVRHNNGGRIFIKYHNLTLSISNTSDEAPIERDDIFRRFHRNAENQKGNGLGLAIVKSICDYHHWEINYTFRDNRHIFTVKFQ